ncbi:hypothetical protein WJX84_003059 [Apatococcus fuscideae]|uniref:DEAD-box ATP-dependent RNA helicase 21 n=1 Tax=Apatococcus fuscideae TaxID=2026836 RepID=A0AAW1T773_9CHLO
MARARSISPQRRDERRDRERREPVRDRRDPAPRHRERSRSRDRTGPPAVKQPRSRSRDREPGPRKRERSREPKDTRDGRDKDRARDRDSKRTRRSRSRERDVSRKSRSRSRSREQRSKQNGSLSRPDVPRPTQEPLVEARIATGPKVEPLSLEDLLKKKQQEQDEANKPKFLSKKQREELALKRREDQVKEQRERQQANQKAHQEYLDSVRRKEHEREAERKADEARKMRDEERERLKMQEMINKQYLGGEKEKKKVKKPSEKFRFNFDWEATDDTSRDLNPLYQDPQTALLLFGRGMRAGVDRREQKKSSAAHENELLRKMREAQGLSETHEDRKRDRERGRAAEKYDELDKGKKDRHWSEKARGEMTERDWRIFREDFNIAYKGVNVSATALPLRNWAEAELPHELNQAIERQGYKKPSPIQMAAIPLGLQQRDVIGVAETGSGKTAAFVLPMLVYIQKMPAMTEEIAAEGPYAVVLAPTRELTQQIEEEAIKLAHFTPYRMVSVVGGQSIEDQGFKLRKGCEMVIATPGRLLDCLEKSYAVLNQCNYVVLDEADRMIDMGFEPQVIAVLDAMPSSNLKPDSDEVQLEASKVYRTTYMFSATMPAAVERLARKYLRRPVVVNIGSAGRATDNVTQVVHMVKDNEKSITLERELERADFEERQKRVIVFANTKRQCETVSKHLTNLDYRCTILHGGKDQDAREASIKGFREEQYNVLVATDVAGRGIDVPDVSLVVNYDMPNTIEQYTHRIGRTGRAGKKGTAITFLTVGDSELFWDLKRVLEDSDAHVPPQLAHHEAAKVKPGSIADRPRREQTVYAKS